MESALESTPEPPRGLFQIKLFELLALSVMTSVAVLIVMRATPFLTDHREWILLSVVVAGTSGLCGLLIPKIDIDILPAWRRASTPWRLSRCALGELIAVAILIPCTDNLGRSTIVANETAAAASCKAYAEGQELFFREARSNTGVGYFAQTLKELKDRGLISGEMANADFASPNPRLYHGYYFKILKAQGASATGGSRTYVINGKMVLGYALLTWPAQYDRWGKDSFIINNQGTIFPSDLGTETQTKAEKYNEFNPSREWWRWIIED